MFTQFKLMPWNGICFNAMNNPIISPDALACDKHITQYTVLYVEDNQANMILLKCLIARRENMKLLTAIDGDLGIIIARAYLPDVILMDINLPGISGFDALKILQADPTTAHIPVIALSSNAFANDIDKGIEAGFFRYLTKPYSIGDLMDSIGEALCSSQKPAK